jgi:hypothetical protein
VGYKSKVLGNQGSKIFMVLIIKMSTKQRQKIGDNTKLNPKLNTRKYVEFLDYDISQYIEKHVVESKRKLLMKALNRNKTQKQIAKYFEEEIISALSQHVKDVKDLDVDVIYHLYHVWFTCFFDVQNFLYILDSSVEFLSDPKCILDTNPRVDEMTSEAEKQLILKYKTILSNRITAYVNDNIGYTPLATAILKNMNQTSNQTTLENIVASIISRLAQLSDDSILALFNTWYDCYFDIFEYFRNLCRPNKDLLEQIDKLQDLRKCSILDMKKRGRSFISEQRYKQKKQNLNPNRAKTEQRKMNVSKHINTVNEKVFEKSRKSELKREMTGIKPSIKQNPEIKPLRSVAKLYNRKYISNFAMCLVLIAHHKSLSHAIPYQISGILKLWYHYARLTRKVFLEFKNEPDHVQVLELWKQLLQEITIYNQDEGKKTYTVINGIRYKLSANNFLYDLIYNNGALNCAGGTSMLYALIKNDEEQLANESGNKHHTIDIRIVNAFAHTLIGIGNDWLIDTTKHPKLYTKEEYEKAFARRVYAFSEKYPHGLINECIKLTEAASSFMIRKNVGVLYDLLETFGITKDKTTSTQIQLFALLCKLNKSNSTMEEYTQTLHECLRNMPDVETKLAGESECLINVAVSQNFKVYNTIRNIWIWLRAYFIERNNFNGWNAQFAILMEVYNKCVEKLKIHDKTGIAYHQPRKAGQKKTDVNDDIDCYNF